MKTAKKQILRVLALILSFAAIVCTLSSCGSETPKTPEAVASAYATAILNGDVEAAVSLLAGDHNTKQIYQYMELVIKDLFTSEPEIRIALQEHFKTENTSKIAKGLPELYKESVQIEAQTLQISSRLGYSWQDSEALDLINEYNSEIYEDFADMIDANSSNKELQELIRKMQDNYLIHTSKSAFITEVIVEYRFERENRTYDGIMEFAMIQNGSTWEVMDFGFRVMELILDDLYEVSIGHLMY